MYVNKRHFLVKRVKKQLSQHLETLCLNKYTKETIVSWLNALADRTGQTAYTLTIGSINLTKLTAEDIAIATNKNWTIA